MRDFTVDLVWAKGQMAFTAIGEWLVCLAGGTGSLLITLAVFVALDYITGVIYGAAGKNLSGMEWVRGCFARC